MILQSDRRAPNILLVDDDELDVENVRRAFSRSNIEPRMWTAADGEEALLTLRGSEYPRNRRLVLLDLNLPKMSGIEFLRVVRADPLLRHQTVVVLTTSNEERDRLDAYGLNVAGYLLKPITFHAFVDMIATLYRYWTFAELE